MLVDQTRVQRGQLRVDGAAHERQRAPAFPIVPQPRDKARPQQRNCARVVRHQRLECQPVTKAHARVHSIDRPRCNRYLLSRLSYGAVRANRPAPPRPGTRSLSGSNRLSSTESTTFRDGALGAGDPGGRAPRGPFHHSSDASCPEMEWSQVLKMHTSIALLHVIVVDSCVESSNPPMDAAHCASSMACIIIATPCAAAPMPSKFASPRRRSRRTPGRALKLENSPPVSSEACAVQ